MNGKRENEIEEFRKSVGVQAEMTLIYFRAILGAGGTMEEAMRLTQAYVAGMFFGRPQQGEKNPEDE